MKAGDSTVLIIAISCDRVDQCSHGEHCSYLYNVKWISTAPVSLCRKLYKATPTSQLFTSLLEKQRLESKEVAILNETVLMSVQNRHFFLWSNKYHKADVSKITQTMIKLMCEAKWLLAFGSLQVIRSQAGSFQHVSSNLALNMSRHDLLWSGLTSLICMKYIPTHLGTNQYNVFHTKGKPSLCIMMRN